MRRKHRPFRDRRDLPPARKCANRAKLGAAIGQGDQHLGGLAAFAAGQGQLKAPVGLLQIGAGDAGQFRAAQRAGETDQQQRPVAQTA